jgi:NADPH-dependent 2,4-dienoyl-CoA reductase/sulfur reductase-like enzyme/rhodanese-related sulfurtransferase
MSSSETTIIIGGVAGGASCAARLRRLDETARIILLERGPHVSFANCGLPYFVGDVIHAEDNLLVTTPAALHAKLGLEVRTRHEAIAIDRTARRLRIRDLTDGHIYEESYDRLVLATGAAPVVPPLPGLDLPGVQTVRNVPDAVRVKGLVDALPAGTPSVVVGGGFIGVEMAENLRHRGLAVTLVEAAPQVLPPFDPEIAFAVRERLEEHGVVVRTGIGLSAVERHDEQLSVRLADGSSLPAALVILAIGVKPESGLAREAGLPLGPRGHIVVDQQCRTADERIYAVGDAIQVRDEVLERDTALPLAGPANRQGRVAAEAIAGRDTRFRGVQGTAILGVFGLAVAATGASEKALRAAGRQDIEVVRIWANHHVGYYPGAKTVAIKLIFARGDGRVLGAQAFGEEGVDRRIDVIATAIQHGGTIHDLAEAELCYSPQYGAAKDPVNLAGMLAANVLDGTLPQKQWHEVDPERDFILDVRPYGAPAGCGDDGHPQIPLEQLRGRLAEVPRDRPIHVCCNIGQTAYLATRVLRAAGIEAYDLSGGRQWRRLLAGAAGAR